MNKKGIATFVDVGTAAAPGFVAAVATEQMLREVAVR